MLLGATYRGTSRIARTPEAQKPSALRANQARPARRFIRQFLIDCPAADDAVLARSELASNAILHSASSRPGGTFTVRARTRHGTATWIEVEDQGGPWPSGLVHPQDGHGLSIVAALTSYWTIRGGDAGRTVSAQIDWP